MVNIRSNKGFSFVELMVIVVIIGLLLSIALPNYVSARLNASNKVCLSNQKIIFTSATMFMLAETESLEDMDDKERLEALRDGQYIKGDQWFECPASTDRDYDDYEIIISDNVVIDVDCKEKPLDHVWP